MNSKIPFAFVLAVIVCITVTAQAFSYGVTVKTADEEFDSQQGEIKIMLASDSSYHNFTFTPNDAKIEKDSVYSAIISSTISMDDITYVLVGWNPASPFNPHQYNATKSPKVYFASVTLNTTIIDPYIHLVAALSRKFCPPNGPIGVNHETYSRLLSCI